MQLNSARTSNWRIVIASFITAIGWGLGWLIGMVWLFRNYFDTTIPLIGVVIFNVGFGLIAVSSLFLGLRIVRISRPHTYKIILYTTWGISAILLTLMTYTDQRESSYNFLQLLPILAAISGVIIALLLRYSLSGMMGIDAINIALGWIGAVIIEELLAGLPDDAGSLFAYLPLGILIIAAIGSAGTFLTIRRVQTRQRKPDPVEAGTAIPLTELMTSTAQNSSFEVIHDSGKAKPKGKPKPWTGIPHLRLYVGTLVGAVILAVVLAALITPIREVRVPGFITPNPTNSTPGPQWGNRLPPHGPLWSATAIARTNSPVGNIPANSTVMLGDRFYDFGAEMWWYQAQSTDGQSGDAWEWQLNSVDSTPPVTSLGQPSDDQPTPINGPVPIGTSSYYQIVRRAFDGQHWLITLAKPDGTTETLNAELLGLAAAGVPLPSVPHMELVGTGRAALITRVTFGLMPVGTAVTVRMITWWYEGFPPTYQIAADINGQTYIGEAHAEDLAYAIAPTATP